jgi:hypothetical protein
MLYKSQSISLMSINKINTTMLQPLIYTKQNTRCILSTFGIGTTYPPLPSSPPTKQYLSIHIRRQGTIPPIITRTQRTTPTRNEMPIYWSIWQSTHSITVPHLSENYMSNSANFRDCPLPKARWIFVSNLPLPSFHQLLTKNRHQLVINNNNKKYLYRKKSWRRWTEKLKYSQQSVKLREEVFDRKSWEMVMPKV